MSKVLVTGAAGFIGFHVCLRLLQEGWDVVGIDNLNDYYDPRLKEDRLAGLADFQNFHFEKLDISDKTAMENLWAGQGPFLDVVHLAAQPGVRYSLENPYAYVNSNCMGHLTVLEMCRHTSGFKHLVYASTSSVYGGNEKLPYAVGDNVDRPVSLYAATKRADELMSYTYSHLYDLPQTGLRFFTVYGPWNRPDMAMHIFTKAIDEGRKVPIYNNGAMKRDFTYVDDIVSGVLATLKVPPVREGKKPPCRVLNIGNSKSENLMDFVAAIEKALGKKADIDFQPLQPGDVLETYADISETTALTGFKPTTSIHDGVPRFVEWYKSYYRR